jgi:hypothetical protein
MFIGGGGMVLGSSGCKKTTKPRKKVVDARSTVYRGVNGSPGQNLNKLFQMMGGVSTIFGVEDVVVIKPNAQWWNQGAPNLLALKTFAELVMERPGGFQGEVVLAENIHRGASPGENAYSGWVPRFKRNSDIDGINNLNELAAHLKTKYGDKFSVCHLIDVEDGGRRIFGPSDGTGYVYCDGTDSVPLGKGGLYGATPEIRQLGFLESPQRLLRGDERDQKLPGGNRYERGTWGTRSA